MSTYRLGQRSSSFASDARSFPWFAEMTGDESGVRVPRYRPIAHIEQFPVPRHILAVEVERLEIRRALLMRPER
jgi:hypothetical protein